MGERLPCTEEVRGSNPLISTTRHVVMRDWALYQVNRIERGKEIARARARERKAIKQTVDALALWSR